jgi:hypothetical protein
VGNIDLVLSIVCFIGFQIGVRARVHSELYRIMYKLLLYLILILPIFSTQYILPVVHYDGPILWIFCVAALILIVQFIPNYRFMFSKEYLKISTVVDRQRIIEESIGFVFSVPAEEVYYKVVLINLLSSFLIEGYIALSLPR